MKVYSKTAEESYVLGVFGTVELLEHQPEHVKRIILSSKADKNQGAIKIQTMAKARHIPVEINDKTIMKLSNKDNTYAIGVFEKYEASLDASKNHVVLDHPGDMGNLGTIIRTMLGFGINDLAIIRPGVDIYDPRVVRASMGALFQMRFAYYDSFDDYLHANPGHHIYPLMTQGAVSLHQVEKKAPYTLVFGNESSGLDMSYLNVGQSVIIPTTDRIDSLNLAMALGITLYEFTKKDFD